MAEYWAVEKFCVHQAMSGVYVAEHVYSIDPDGLNKPLFQQLWNLGNSEHDILHQTDADVIHKKHLPENSQVHFHNYHKHKTGIIVRFGYIIYEGERTLGPTTSPSSTIILTSALSSAEVCIVLGGCIDCKFEES